MASATAQPSAERCGSGGGPTICVRFDNLAQAPEENVHFVFDFSDPPNPSVELRRGRNVQGALYEWRVWSKDAQENPANIGSITGPGEFDYDVKILNGLDGPGATNVSAIILDPLGDHFSSITAGSKITGDLTGDLLVEKDALGTGGEADFTIDGNATGNITIPTIPTGTRLDINGDASGTVQVGEVVGPFGVGGSLAISSVSGNVDAAVVKGLMSVGNIVGNGAVRVTQRMDGGSLNVMNAGPTASVIIADMVNGSVVTLSDWGATWAGQVVLQNGVPLDQVVYIYGALTETAVIDLNGHDVDGWIDVIGGGSYQQLDPTTACVIYQQVRIAGGWRPAPGEEATSEFGIFEMARWHTKYL